MGAVKSKSFPQIQCPWWYGNVDEDRAPGGYLGTWVPGYHMPPAPATPLKSLADWGWSEPRDGLCSKGKPPWKPSRDQSLPFCVKGRVSLSLPLDCPPSMHQSAYELMRVLFASGWWPPFLPSESLMKKSTTNGDPTVQG